ncbi:MAG: hypothetical protein M1817_005301 [Caeruleum heppii]|nr:MAG: hypothetical protein M1817_005301 [Caeruleum heppii]
MNHSEEPRSNNDHLGHPEADPKIVMAEQSAHDVVNQTRSVGDASLSDASANNIQDPQPIGAVKKSLPSTIDDNAGRQTETPTASRINDTLKESSLNGLDEENSRIPQETTTSTLRATSPPTDSASEATNGALHTPAILGPQIERSGSADLSATSDNDTGKPDNLDSQSGKEDSDGKGHVRTNSIRKPTSFKAVSVTKNFLAKAIGGATNATKLGGDKGQAGSPNQSAPRPRLVAKTGSGLRDAVPRPNSASAGGGKGSGPDPSQVWNKNRPVQPPAPKQFTDEELKQQYGIHLATRLQADDAGKEAKWADIDDDDDDWAPETIEWNDGTKITLSQQTEPSAVVEVHEPVGTIAALDANDGDVKPSDILTEVTAAPDGSDDVKSNQGLVVQPRAGGLKLKGAPEKPVLVAKPPVPSPAKSPWAPLPPVDKVPPAMINPLQQQPPGSRFGHKDPHGFESMPQMSPSAQEIAADDFTRSWRDGHNTATSRELFNSRSGRYEPVIEGRRGSIRNDQHFRQPSVLQRPSATDAKAPAEPSAAFQSRSGGSDDPWSRRRTSSNVSGGSGNVGRRMSIGRGPDITSAMETQLAQRRGSRQELFSEGHDPRHLQSPTLSQKSMTHSLAGHSPLQMSQSKPWQARSTPAVTEVNVHSPAMSSAPPHSQDQGQARANLPHTPPISREDEVAMQKRVMAQSRELAMKRREEQNAKEVAEKEERIRKKMEALGTPVQSAKIERAATVASSTQGAAAGSAESLEEHESARPEAQDSQKDQRIESGRTDSFKAALPRTIKKHIEDAHRSSQLPQSSVGTKPPSNATVTAAEASKGPVPGSQMPNGVSKPPTNDIAHTEKAKHNVGQLSTTSRESQPWKHVPAGPDTYTSWGAGGMTTHTTPGGNLWGSPSNDRGLGNGTFDRGYERIMARQEGQHQQQTNSVTPGPIGPPPTSARSQKPFDPSPDSRTQSNQAMNSGAGPNIPSLQSHVVNAGDSTGRPPRTQGRGEGQLNNPVRPIGQLPTGSTLTEDQRVKAVSAWKQLPAQLERDEAEARTKAANEHAARIAEEARTGIKRETYAPIFKETWRQVAVGGVDNSRRVVSSSTVVAGSNHSRPEADTRTGEQQHSPAGAHPAITGAAGTTTGNTRPSRFFPHSPVSTSSGTTIRNAYSDAVDVDYRSSPPPDSFEHPVYDGDVGHPLVLLPPTKPVVKLPPAVTTPVRTSQGAPTSRSDSGLPQATRKNSTSSSSWQERINGLFGNRKQSSPPKVQALMVSPASKAPLEVLTSLAPATVSLPRSEDGDQTPRSASYEMEDAMTKMTEDALLEEREFGSLPRVKLPNQAPTNAWRPAEAPSGDRIRFQRPLEAFSVLPYLPSILLTRQTAQGTAMNIRLPGSETSKTVVLLRSSNGSRPQRSASHQHSFKGSRRGNKARDGSNTWAMQRGSNPGRSNIVDTVWSQPTAATGAH